MPILTLKTRWRQLQKKKKSEPRLTYKENTDMTENTTPTVRELIDRGAQIYEDKTFIKFVRDGVVEERSYRTTQQNALAVCRWIRSL